MASYLITGASRGLGLCLAKQLASRSTSEVATVFATARSENSVELKELVESAIGRVYFIKLDVTSQDSIDTAFEQVKDIVGSQGLDVLVNNAGIATMAPNGIQSMTNLGHFMQTNVIAVHNVTAAFLPLLRQSSRKLVVNISTTLGSFGHADFYAQFPVPEYKISKSALNRLTVEYAYQFEKEGFIFIAVSPGWLKTDLGGENADLEPHVGADAVIKIMDKADKSSNGKFLDIHVPGLEELAPGRRHRYRGDEIPW